MKNSILKLTMLTLVLAATITLTNKVKARDLPQNYLTFIWDSPTSGWLWCGGTGVCAQVFGSTIYFGNYVGNWGGEIATRENDETGYFVTEVEGNN